MRHRTPSGHRQYARHMRKDPTDAEALLWQALSGRKLEGFKFRRQVPLKGFILDFVCFEARLIVEIDGWQHADNPRDAQRDAAFRADGFRVLRFWNDEVIENSVFVCAAILAELRNTGE